MAHAQKIVKQRVFQLITFIIFLIGFATLSTTWFGHSGMTDLSGFIVLKHPIAIAGIALFLVALWYNFVSVKRRKAFGYIGLGMFLFAEMLEFITFPSGSIMGITIGAFSYDVPTLYNFSIQNCILETEIGFYISVAITLFIGISFYVFTRKLQSNKIEFLQSTSEN